MKPSTKILLENVLLLRDIGTILKKGHQFDFIEVHEYTHYFKIYHPCKDGQRWSWELPKEAFKEYFLIPTTKVQKLLFNKLT